MPIKANIQFIMLDEHDTSDNAAISNTDNASWYVLSAPPRPKEPLEWRSVTKNSTHVITPLYKIRIAEPDLLALGFAIGSQLPEDITDVRIIWRQSDSDVFVMGVAAR